MVSRGPGIFLEDKGNSLGTCNYFWSLWKRRWVLLALWVLEVPGEGAQPHIFILIPLPGFGGSRGAPALKQGMAASRATGQWCVLGETTLGAPLMLLPHGKQALHHHHHLHRIQNGLDWKAP